MQSCWQHTLPPNPMVSPSMSFELSGIALLRRGVTCSHGGQCAGGVVLSARCDQRQRRTCSALSTTCAAAAAAATIAAATARRRTRRPWWRRVAGVATQPLSTGARRILRHSKIVGTPCLPRAASAGPTELPGHPHKATPLWTLKATQLLIFAANVCVIRYITVYYHQLGLSRSAMGLLLLAMPLASFFGGLFWSTIVDYTGDYKRTLIGTSVMGVMVVFSYMSPAVQNSFAVLTLITVLHGFFASPSSALVDALCLKVLSEQKVDTEAYGDQRLWSAVGWGGMALVAGKLVDASGCYAIFLSFAALVAINIGIIAKFMPGDSTGGSSTSAGQPRQGAGGWLQVLGSFRVLWLMLNLVIYGSLMALVESYLNVFLLEDFRAVPKVLLGAATAVMCLFEIPVFKYVSRFWGEDDTGLINVLIATMLVLALRCVLYAALPRNLPWLVLLVEPLHGFTFAAMWCATVEYARRLAPPGMEAKMQALANGLFYYISFAAGSLAWGFLVQHPPKGLGFTASFLLDAVLVVGWTAIWRLGWAIYRGRSRRTGIAAPVT